MQYDVITIGGATLDIFLSIDQDSDQCCVKKDETGEFFSIRRGAKVPVTNLTYDVGGNATNVAVGLSRLGIKTATYIHYGSDEISQKIKTTLEKEGVGTEFIIQDKGETSSIGIAINFAGERNLFVHHIVRAHVLPPISVPKWIYLTSMGDKWKNAYAKVLMFTIQHKVKLAFNPGSHQLQGEAQHYMDQVKACDVLFVNKEEASQIAHGLLLSPRGEEDIKTLLAQLHSLKDKIVVITDGTNGSYAIDEKGQMYAMQAIPNESVERTGAGDAYASGFLAALVSGKKVPDAMCWGAFNAASVVNNVGAEKGLLKKEELAEKLSANKDFTAKVITSA